MKVLIFTVDAFDRDIAVVRDIPNNLPSLKEIVGGWLEGITLRDRPDDTFCFVNEDGISLNLRENKLASSFLNKHGTNVTIVGNMLVVGRDGADETDCPQDLIDEVTKS